MQGIRPVDKCKNKNPHVLYLFTGKTNEKNIEHLKNWTPVSAVEGRHLDRSANLHCADYC